MNREQPRPNIAPHKSLKRNRQLFSSVLLEGVPWCGGSERRIASEAPLSAHTTPRAAPRARSRSSLPDPPDPHPPPRGGEGTTVFAASAHTLATAARKMTFEANHDSSAAAEVEVKEEEEETLGQLRDRQVLASARAAVPGPRAAFVHIKVEDSTSGEDADGEGGGGRGGGGEATGGKGDGEGEVKEEEQEEEETAEPHDLHAHVPGTSLEGGSEAVRPQRLPPGAPSEPGSPRARLRAPGRLADNAVRDNDVQQQEEEEEEAGLALLLKKRGGSGHAGNSRFKGVFWNKNANKCQAQCERKHLGITPRRKLRRARTTSTSRTALLLSPRYGAPLRSRASVGGREKTNGRQSAKGDNSDITRRRRTRRAHAANTSRTASIL